MDFIKKIIVAILTLEARLVLWRYKPRIIAVTGSVGKTTTKDAIFAALSSNLHIRKSEKSLNSDFGVPLTILGLESGWNDPLKWFSNIFQGLLQILIRTNYPEWLVIEVGADRPGDIRRIARWLRPDIAVITAIPKIPVHVEYFASPEEVFKEKRALAEYLKPGGTLVLYGDDSRLQNASTLFQGATVTYGYDDKNTFTISHDAILYEGSTPTGISFRVDYAGASIPIVLYGALGRPRAYAGTAALAVATIIQNNMIEAGQSLGNWTPSPGRLRLIPGMHNSTIIDDTYNASPAATTAALDTLKNVSAQRRILMIADMMELGKYSADAHKEIGVYAAACCDVLITVGFRARAIAEAALDAGMRDEQVLQYEQGESERAGLELAPNVKEGDVILVKGSQSMRMEKAVAALLAQPEKAAELLVRQDEAWQNR
ncbi:MAG: UDP-N-acetylmuramoylalanyl-D-glutamyl-2,6-diaminopimelate--D-alanyl-D-alanyl ligase [Candidatus Kaiserbacteria bacterium]|nr:UDP-N-acetylmuramoylalanyl-D-glutamyl-2,6-diaminopimelate--D-alanyl-D-alanyl ligase [Candidatus Kaiserbacteria bacterium]